MLYVGIFRAPWQRKWGVMADDPEYRFREWRGYS